jgi:tRNA threonylcarbamoyl adenosine modification protein YeaZ
MKILALEFSSDWRSAAVVRDGVLAGQTSEHGAPSTQAIDLIQRALNQAGLSREDIDCLAVGLGPGSYTGIRIAIALAQGWSLARAVKPVGVSSACGVAERARAEGLRGLVHVAIDAQRNEAYLAAYDISEPGCEERTPLRLVGMDEARNLATAGQVVVGPGTPQWCSGARNIIPTAADLGAIAAANPVEVQPECLEPIYLRQTTFVKARPVSLRP